MKRFLQVIFGLVIILHSCKTEPAETETIDIQKPLLTEYHTNDSLVKRAVFRVQEYLGLKESGANISDFYLDSIYVMGDTVNLVVMHTDYYRQLKYNDEMKALEKAAEARGDTLISIYAPPTGNYSGMDRHILYLSRKDSLIDLLIQ